ncbi:tetratricopeptide repeat protein [Phosphitispora sp. TUW77]|uniref:tetratricopeptide repeat protein n=1 Tax=Phosphitispora sp. TUW77 TaxID=3152361 RepID=UPI003AB4AC9A
MEPNLNQDIDKGVLLKKTVLIIIVVAIIAISIFTVIGYAFFWRTAPEQKQDIELNSINYIIEAKPNSVEGYLAKGNYYIRNDHPEEALNWIEKAAGIEPDNKAVQFNRGLALMQLKKYDEAIKNMEPLTDDKVFDFDAEYFIGAVYYLKGDYPKAIEKFGLALLYNPASADAHVFLAKAYYKNGEKDKADEHLAKALAMVPIMMKPLK